MTRTPVLPRILIVEDHADTLQPLTELLHTAGYESAIAPNGDGALATALMCGPDLALIDLAAPGGDSIAVLRALHASDPELPAIILTRTGSSEEVRAAMINGAFDFYSRPFDNRELLASIADALASRRGRGARREVNCV